MQLDRSEVQNIIAKAIEESPKNNQMDGSLTRVGKGFSSIEEEFDNFRLIQKDMQQTLKVILDAVLSAKKRGKPI